MVLIKFYFLILIPVSVELICRGRDTGDSETCPSTVFESSYLTISIAIPLSALLKDTTSELASLSSKLFLAERQAEKVEILTFLNFGLNRQRE